MVDRMERTELRDLALSAAALAFAFSLARVGGVKGIGELSLILIAAAFVTVSLSFILHEMAHRYFARKFGCYAEYRMWREGLVLALVSSLFGFVFAAPGAVYIHPRTDLWGAAHMISKKRYGIVALSGPVVNLIIGGIFFALAALVSGGFLQSMLLSGVAINIWLALFNLFPIPPLDGYTVFSWDKRIWGILFAVCFVLFVVA